MRWLRFLFQRIRRGWDDSETWNLEVTIARFILPRLRRFREINNGFPGDTTEEGWNAELDEMIFTFDKLANTDWIDWSEDEAARVKQGLELFGKRFQHLWW